MTATHAAVVLPVLSAHQRVAHSRSDGIHGMGREATRVGAFWKRSPILFRCTLRDWALCQIRKEDVPVSIDGPEGSSRGLSPSEIAKVVALFEYIHWSFSTVSNVVLA